MTININEALDRVKNSVYGKDVRQAIIDSINAMYADESMAGNANMEVAAARGLYATLLERLNSIDTITADIPLKADKTAVQALASGGPKGVYATLSALQTAYPTGNTNVYVVTADGKWYYWNGSAWTAGGTYQGTAIAAGSITKSLLAQKSVDRTIIDGLTLSPNLYNPKKATLDTQQTAATTAVNTSYNLSEYIDVVSGQQYIISYARSIYCSYFDANKVYISSPTLGSGVVSENYVITIPDGVKYIRLNVYKTPTSPFMFAAGATMPAYQPYYTYADFLDTRDASVITQHLANEAVTNEKIKMGTLDLNRFIGYAAAQNLFDKTTALVGKTQVNQYVSDNASYALSDYIAATPADTFTITYARGTYAAFYDANKAYISAAPSNSTTNVPTNFSFNPPTGTAYLRLNVYLSVMDTYMIVKNSAMPSIYVPYGSSSGEKFIDDLRYKPKSVGLRHLEDSLVSLINSGSGGGTGGGPGYWAGKKANFLGDSITFGQYLSSQSQAWATLVGNALGLSVVRNYGISGSGVGIGGGGNPMCDRYSTMDDDADLIFFMGGRNDFSGGTNAFGTIDSAPTDKNTYYGALKVIAEGLINKYPTKTIVFVTPPHGSSATRPETAPNTTTGRLYKEYVQANRDVASLYGIPVCDIWNISGIQPLIATNNITYFLQSDGTTKDGVHPNATGHARIADRVAGFTNTLAV